MNEVRGLQFLSLIISLTTCFNKSSSWRYLSVLNYTSKYMKDHIFELRRKKPKQQLPVGLIAQLVEHGIAEVMGSNPVYS